MGGVPGAVRIDARVHEGRLPHQPPGSLPAERLVIYCQTTSVSVAHATHCATYCTPCRPLMRVPAHHGVRTFHKKSTCLTQLTLGPYVVHIWSRNPQHVEATKPANSTVWTLFRKVSISDISGTYLQYKVEIFR